jgi:hypothetical protein
MVTSKRKVERIAETNRELWKLRRVSAEQAAPHVRTRTVPSDAAMIDADFCYQ